MEDEIPESERDFVPLTAAQARELRARNPAVSPWRVVGAQVAAGAVIAVVVWMTLGQAALAWSAAYGALVVVLPAALFAHGLTGRLASINPATAIAGFFVWEMVKIALMVAMLIAAPRLVEGLSWPVMLVSMVVTMQVYWAALWLAPKKRLTNLIDGQVKDGR